MKFLQYLLIAFLAMGIFTGCGSDDDDTGVNTQFFSDVQSAIQQDEDDEPLEIDETNDETTSFDSLTENQ